MAGFGRSGSYGRSRDDYEGGSSVDMFVPAGDCGKIIGRGGTKIREMQDRTGCKINVCRDEEGNGTRRVELNGTEDAIDRARSMISEIMEGGGDDRGGRRQNYGGSYYGGSGGGGSGSGMKNIIQINSSYVGRIIGKGGSRIRELQDETGCRINVSRDGGSYGQTDVELIGSQSAIDHAKERIDDITSQAY